MAAQENKDGAAAGGGDGGAAQGNKRSSLLDKVYGEQIAKGQLGEPGNGCLFKLGGKLVKFTWQERHCRMINFEDDEDQPRLSWSLEPGTVERGFLDLNEAIITTPASHIQGAIHPEFSFTIQQKEDGQKLYHFEAPSAELFAGWMDVLRKRVAQTLPAGPLPNYAKAILVPLTAVLEGEVNMINTNWYEVHNSMNDARTPNWRATRKAFFNKFMKKFVDGLIATCNASAFFKESLLVMWKPSMAFYVTGDGKMFTHSLPVAHQNNHGWWAYDFLTPAAMHIAVGGRITNQNWEDNMAETYSYKIFMSEAELNAGRAPCNMTRDAIVEHEQATAFSLNGIATAIGNAPWTMTIDYAQIWQAYKNSTTKTLDYTNARDVPEYIKFKLEYLEREVKEACKQAGFKRAIAELTQNKRLDIMVGEKLPHCDKDIAKRSGQLNFINGGIELRYWADKSGRWNDGIPSGRVASRDESFDRKFLAEIIGFTQGNAGIKPTVSGWLNYDASENRYMHWLEMFTRWLEVPVTIEVDLVACCASASKEVYLACESKLGRDLRDMPFNGFREGQTKIAWAEQKKFWAKSPSGWRFFVSVGPLEADSRNSQTAQVNFLAVGTVEIRIASLDATDVSTHITRGYPKDWALALSKFPM